jgi:hypothetical protein
MRVSSDAKSFGFEGAVPWDTQTPREAPAIPHEVSRWGSEHGGNRCLRIMPPVKARPWNEGLDNFGENLIRLGAGLKSIQESPSATGSDANFAAAVAQAATGFRLAFRQALPVLTRGERAFLQLVPISEGTELTAHPREDSPQHAHTLVHEGVLACVEVLSLLERIDYASTTQPGSARQVLQGSLAALAESTTAVGWEIRTICHEFASEVKLSGVDPANLEDLGPGAVGLIHDMAVAAHHLRAVRREWYRVDQRLVAAVASSPVSEGAGRAG